MENPSKSNLRSLAWNKISKVRTKPLEFFTIPKLFYYYIMELKHQRRFINEFNDNLKGTHSSRRLNSIIKKRGQKTISYLEIGVAHGYTFQAVNTDTKIGVDPFPKSRIRKPQDNLKIVPKASNDFFEFNLKKFDLIFVDGMHTFEQSYSDLINSLNALELGGALLVDDVIPGDKYSAMPDIELCRQARIQDGEKLETWSGDVFKSIIALKKLHPSLNIVTIISPDHPQSIIWKNPSNSEFFNLSEDLKQTNEFSKIDYEIYFTNLIELNQIFNFQLEWRAINQYIDSTFKR